jgi:hypothetical protein
MRRKSQIRRRSSVEGKHNILPMPPDSGREDSLVSRCYRQHIANVSCETCLRKLPTESLILMLGDLICIIFGRSVPVVLRQVTKMSSDMTNGYISKRVRDLFASRCNWARRIYFWRSKRKPEREGISARTASPLE